MNFVLNMMNFVLHMTNCVLKMMNFVVYVTNFVLKMTNFVFKMTNSVGSDVHACEVGQRVTEQYMIFNSFIMIHLTIDVIIIN